MKCYQKINKYRNFRVLQEYLGCYGTGCLVSDQTHVAGFRNDGGNGGAFFLNTVNLQIAI